MGKVKNHYHDEICRIREMEGMLPDDYAAEINEQLEEAEKENRHLKALCYASWILALILWLIA